MNAIRTCTRLSSAFCFSAASASIEVTSMATGGGRVGPAVCLCVFPMSPCLCRGCYGPVLMSRGTQPSIYELVRSSRESLQVHAYAIHVDQCWLLGFKHATAPLYPAGGFQQHGNSKPNINDGGGMRGDGG